MKKIVFTLVLSMVLSISVFAEGEIPIGGRSCPPEQTCPSANNTDSNDNTDTQDTDNSISEQSETTVSDSTLIDFGNFYLFLKSIF